MILDIHLEWCDDKGERLKKIAEAGKSFNISLVPVLLLPEHKCFKNRVYPNNYYYNKDIVSFLKIIPRDYPHVTFGQQGFSHYCPDCYNTEIKTNTKNGRKFSRDPWHENRCLYNPTLSFGEQTVFMARGKEIIEDKVGISPIMYVPPNHQYDKNTKIAAEHSGFEYFATKGLINIPPYTEVIEDGKLKVLPERKLGQEGEIFYTHYDKMKDNFDKYLEIINSSDSLSMIWFQEKPIVHAPLNEKLIFMSKIVRDKGLR